MSALRQGDNHPEAHKGRSRPGGRLRPYTYSLPAVQSASKPDQIVASKYSGFGEVTV